MVQILTDISLNDLNTFKVKSKASSFIQFDSLEQLQSICSEIARYKERFVLGGGSNLLFVGDYSGLVIYPQLKGIEILSEDANQVTLRVAASENWHQFVRYCLERDYFGLENLALIPGTVGAAPVQNIGAYGVEVESMIRQVNCFDLEDGESITLSHQDCQFAYRDSFIKRAGQGRYLVMSVDFKLSKQANLVLSYKPLKDYFIDARKVTAKQVFDRVCEIRSEKLPDPVKLANAGSFFKNPIVDKQHYQSLKQTYPKLVAYPVETGDEKTYKIAAGWLIEKAGFKGKMFNKVGVHKHQALVLVNYSDDDGANILALADLIISKIEELFDICLESEVRILGENKKTQGSTR